MSCSQSQHEIVEGSSYDATFTLLDEDGTAVALAAIDTITLTLYDQNSGSIINSRNAQDVLNANDGTFHATSGLFTWTSRPLDHPIVSTNEPSKETHIAHVRVTWTAGGLPKAASHEFVLTVCNIRKFAVA